MEEESVMMVHELVVVEEEEDNDMLIISPPSQLSLSPSSTDDHEHDIWEFINPSDAEDSDSDSVLSLDNGFLSLLSQQAQLTQQIENPNPDHGPPELEVDVAVRDDVVYDYGCDVKERGDVDGDDDGDDGDDDGYGLDDELVPWHVSGKLGRERMRKLGKRVFAKMGSSKRNPYLYVKPGCVRGKHGLGIKA